MAAHKNNKYAVGNKGGGRPTAYKKEFVRIAANMCRLGATDNDLAEALGVGIGTINAWKLKHKEFSEALKTWKAEADERVERSLYDRAMGYSHPEDKIFNDGGIPMIVPTIKHYPPDTTAAIFWLKNRKSADWRDKQELELNVSDDIAEMLDARRKRAKAAKPG
jgi:hypothetical protein